MSNATNDRLLERARDLVEDVSGMSYLSTLVPEKVNKYIKNNDLEGLYAYVVQTEAELSQAHFYDNDIIKMPYNFY